MSHTGQITAFAAELDRLVERFSSEFDLPVVSVIGVLQLKQHLLLRDTEKKDDES